MLFHLRKAISFGVRTAEQEHFLDKLPSMSMSNDEEVVASLRYVYDHRVQKHLSRNTLKTVNKCLT